MVNLKLRGYTTRAKGAIISTMYGVFGTARSVTEARGEYNILETKRGKLIDDISTLKTELRILGEKSATLLINFDAALALLKDYSASYGNVLDVIKKESDGMLTDILKLQEQFGERNAREEPQV